MCGHAEHPFAPCGAGPKDRPILCCACGVDRLSPGQIGIMVAELEARGYAVDPKWKAERGYDKPALRRGDKELARPDKESKP